VASKSLHQGKMLKESHVLPSRHRSPPTLILLAAIVTALLLFTGAVVQAKTAPVLEARVSQVLDGDTFTLKGESRRVRIWGLDAPEWNHPGGSASTSTLRRLISGKQLRCAVLDIDRYGRLVAQCFLADGRDIATAMIRSGAATEFCRYSRGYYGTC
jgi:micrococcal nuclease